jgi:FtsP/CotA-like multicopper oxidase with cupredoxin domain
MMDWMALNSGVEMGMGGQYLPVENYLTNPPEKVPPEESGWKDKFKAYPGQVTRFIIRWAPQDLKNSKAGENNFAFDPTVGPGYVWHCHIIDHEDNEMMRPYTVVK